MADPEGAKPTDADGVAGIGAKDGTEHGTSAYSPPPLPPVRGGGLAHIVVPGTAIWFVAFVVLLFFTSQLREHHAMIWLWTCLAGWVLGLIGLAIYTWQRAAARRGSRASSTMALDERI